MIHYLLRRRSNDEALALFKINSKVELNTLLIPPICRNRFGPYVKIHRMGRFVYRLMLSENSDDIEKAFSNYDFKMEKITQSEWETWNAMELVPCLKTAVVA